MGAKKTVSFTFNWQDTNPAPTFNPTANPQVLSGVTAGVMANTDTIYSNIQNVDLLDNHGVQIDYSGNAVGTITILASNNGRIFYPLTLVPAITQPAGNPGGCIGSLNQLPYKYIMFRYVNTSGNGLLTIINNSKDLN